MPDTPRDLSEMSVAAAQAAATRIDYIDWLRVLAVAGVFVYHSLQPFPTHEWHVKNNELSPAIDAVVSFNPRGIALFFLIAGASSLLALRHRTAGQYVGERLKRLLIPLIAALCLAVPGACFHRGRAPRTGTDARLCSRGAL